MHICRIFHHIGQRWFYRRAFGGPPRGSLSSPDLPRRACSARRNAPPARLSTARARTTTPQKPKAKVDYPPKKSGLPSPKPTGPLPNASSRKAPFPPEGLICPPKLAPNGSSAPSSESQSPPAPPKSSSSSSSSGAPAGDAATQLGSPSAFTWGSIRRPRG
eukprot:182429-Prorocentrum_minimum.AAC.2